MSMPNEDDTSASQFQISSHLFSDLLDSIIVDVASESHRIAKLGLDQNLEQEEEELRLSEQARADASNISEANGKYVVDVFGQNHPTVATDSFECVNCTRIIAVGRFAPHLEKCMGKGRKARKVTRSSTATQNRHSRGGSANSPYSNPTTSIRLSNGAAGITGEEYSNGTNEDS